jgi:Holliday junction DNA helicase RuvB
MQQGFLLRTPRGRMATPLAYRHFGLKAPKRTETLQAELLDFDADE